MRTRLSNHPILFLDTKPSECALRAFSAVLDNAYVAHCIQGGWAADCKAHGEWLRLTSLDIPALLKQNLQRPGSQYETQLGILY